MKIEIRKLENGNIRVVVGNNEVILTANEAESLAAMIELSVKADKFTFSMDK